MPHSRVKRDLFHIPTIRNPDSRDLRNPLALITLAKYGVYEENPATLCVTAWRNRSRIVTHRKSRAAITDLRCDANRNIRYSEIAGTFALDRTLEDLHKIGILVATINHWISNIDRWSLNREINRERIKYVNTYESLNTKIALNHFKCIVIFRWEIYKDIYWTVYIFTLLYII